MTDIATQITRFLVNNGDVIEPGDFVPHTSEGNTVTPLVDGENYFHALRIEVDKLKAGGTGKFFYFTDWWLALTYYPGGSPGMGLTSWTGSIDPIMPFQLDDGLGGPYPDFIDELATMSDNGTDVRALVWINPLILQFEEAAARSGLLQVNASNLLSIDALRKQPRMSKSACLNILGHPMGSMHMKMIICGDSTGGRAYVSGIEFVKKCIDGQRHSNGKTFGWHDAGVKIEGSAVQGVYNYYQQMWKEILDRSTETLRIGYLKVKTKVDGTPKVPDRTFSSPTTRKMHVQILRTAPAMNFALGETSRLPKGCFTRLVSGFRRDKWSSPAQNGIFEFKLSLKKAISNAQNYIYVEDQGFIGQPIMDWLRNALASNANLKLIMVHHADPADGPNTMKSTSTAINKHLCSTSMNMKAQVAFYERQDNVVIHSKTWIIDDQFIIVGSANCYRRSLYADGEVSVAILDDDTTPNHVAIRYRSMLWAEHCGKYSDPDRSAFNDLAHAIKIWDPTWGIGGAPPATGPTPGKLLPVFQSKKVPFKAGTAKDEFPSVDTSLSDIIYDQIDVDSRLEY